MALGQTLLPTSSFWSTAIMIGILCLALIFKFRDGKKYRGA